MRLRRVDRLLGAVHGDAGPRRGEGHLGLHLPVLHLFYDLAFSGLYQAYACEVLPYDLRAKGLAVVVICAYTANFFGTYVSPVGLANAGWKYYLLYDCWLVVVFVVFYFLLVETKNTTLEEVSVIFDGDDALVGGGKDMSRREMQMIEMKSGAAVEEHVEVANPIQV